MKRLSMGIGIAALLVLLLASAFAFSLTLQNLRVSAFSFTLPAQAAAIEAPMTGADESAISAVNSGGVRLEEFDQTEGHLCRKGKAQTSATDF